MDDEILIEVCWAISGFSYGCSHKVQAVIESGVCQRLVDLLMHPSTSVQTPALRSVRHIVTGDGPQIQVVIESGALPALLSLLSSPEGCIRGDACWAISNIIAGSPPQVQAIIEANIIPELIKPLSSPVLEVREKAIWALGNLAGSSPVSRNYVLQQGALRPLLKLLSEDHELSTQRKAAWTLASLCPGGSLQPDWELVRLRALISFPGSRNLTWPSSLLGFPRINGFEGVN